MTKDKQIDLHRPIMDCQNEKIKVISSIQ
uniref:Uncharacterized protein n=1 Tax=Arundo donax TaxID=35708 RepID=A0A0A9BRB3_ARUDO